MQDDQSKDFEEVFWYVPKTKLNEAQKRFDRYLELVFRMYERIEQDPEAYAELRPLLEEERTRTGLPAEERTDSEDSNPS